MATRTVTATITKPDGDAHEGAVVEFELLSPGGYESTGEIYPGYTVTAVADANGLISVDLWRSGASVETATWRCTLPSGEQFTLEIPDAGTDIDLSALRSA